MSSATRLDTGRWIAKRKEAVTAPNVNRTAYGPRATPCQADDKLSRAREVGGRRRCGGAAPGVCVGEGACGSAATAAAAAVGTACRPEKL